MTAETGSATGATYQPDASFVVTSSTEQEDITKPRQAEGRPPRMTRLWTTYSEGEAGQDLRRSLEEEAEGIDANIGGNDGTPKGTGRDGAHRPLGEEIDRDKHVSPGSHDVEVRPIGTSGNIIAPLLQQQKQ